MTPEQGQALAEFLLTGLVVSAIVLATPRLLGSAWDRAHCSHLAFETARRILAGTPGVPSDRAGVRVLESDDLVIVEARCGRQAAQVGFRKLETLEQWR